MGKDHKRDREREHKKDKKHKRDKDKHKKRRRSDSSSPSGSDSDDHRKRQKAEKMVGQRVGRSARTTAERVLLGGERSHGPFGSTAVLAAAGVELAAGPVQGLPLRGLMRLGAPPCPTPPHPAPPRPTPGQKGRQLLGETEQQGHGAPKVNGHPGGGGPGRGRGAAATPGTQHSSWVVRACS
jgi:hypothetical protein